MQALNPKPKGLAFRVLGVMPGVEGGGSQQGTCWSPSSGKNILDRIWDIWGFQYGYGQIPILSTLSLQLHCSQCRRLCQLLNALFIIGRLTRVQSLEKYTGYFQPYCNRTKTQLN